MEKEELSLERPIAEMEAAMEDIPFLIHCQYVIQIIEIKLRMIQEEMEEEYERPVISYFCSRIKSPESICRKLIKKKKEMTFASAQRSLSDIIGVRVTCFFADDIYEIVKRFSAQSDIHVLREKDYIRNPKPNGYHSYHMIVEVPVYGEEGCAWRRMEIQFRTVAMDFWAQLNYQLCYKKNLEKETYRDIESELAVCAAQIEQMDSAMMRLRKKIESA